MILECKLKNNNNNIKVAITRTLIDRTLESILLDDIESKKGMMIISDESIRDFGCNQIGFKNPPVEIRFTDKKIEIVSLNYKGMHLMEYLYTQVTAEFNDLILDRKKHKLSLSFSSDVDEDIKKKNEIIYQILFFINGLLTLEECPFFSVYGILENQIPICRGKIECEFEILEHMNNMILYIPDEIYICDCLTKEVTQIKYELKISELCNIDVPMYVEDFSLPEVIDKQDCKSSVPYKSSDVFSSIKVKENIKRCFIINTGRGVITGTPEYTYLNTCSLKSI